MDVYHIEHEGRTLDILSVETNLKNYLGERYIILRFSNIEPLNSGDLYMVGDGIKIRLWSISSYKLNKKLSQKIEWVWW